MNEKNKRVIPLQLHPHQSLGSLCLKDILKCTLYFRVIYTPFASNYTQNSQYMCLSVS